MRGLGLDRHPELLLLYFGNYRRLVYLAQADDAELSVCAEAAAATLGLAYERRLTGLGELAPAIAAFSRSAAHAPTPATVPLGRPAFHTSKIEQAPQDSSRFLPLMGRPTTQPSEERPIRRSGRRFLRSMGRPAFQTPSAGGLAAGRGSASARVVA
jgi:hypothetical protein